MYRQGKVLPGTIKAYFSVSGHRMCLSHTHMYIYIYTSVLLCISMHR